MLISKHAKLKKLCLIFATILLSGIPLLANAIEVDIPAKNGIYLEGYLIRHDFSNGLVSLNYERTIGKKNRANLRLGLYPDYESTISIPITFTWITSPHRAHHFEYGIGGVFRIEHYVDPIGINQREWFYDVAALMLPIMYRYQGNSPWYFRAGINLFVSWPILPSPSISVGYRF